METHAHRIIVSITRGVLCTMWVVCGALRCAWPIYVSKSCNDYCECDARVFNKFHVVLPSANAVLH